MFQSIYQTQCTRIFDPISLKLKEYKLNQDDKNYRKSSEQMKQKRDVLTFNCVVSSDCGKGMPTNISHKVSNLKNEQKSIKTIDI